MQDTNVENIPVEFWKGSKHSSENYCTKNSSWTLPHLKGHKGRRNVNIKVVWDIDVENIPIDFQNDHNNKVALT